MGSRARQVSRWWIIAWVACVPAIVWAGTTTGDSAPAVPVDASESAEVVAAGDPEVAAGETVGASESTAANPPRLPQIPFGVGEKFVFSLQYGVIKAGTATLNVEDVVTVDDVECYKLSSVTRSNALFSRFYKVRDRVESIVDTARLLTLRSSKDLSQGDYRKQSSGVWDQQAQLVTYANGDTVSLDEHTRDVLGAFFYVRTLDLRVGDRVPLAAHDSGKTYPLWIEVLDEETIDTPLGTFDCLVVEPKLQTEGLFRRTGSLKVWLTRDERHMPVMMQSKIKIGAVSAILIEHQPGATRRPQLPGVHAN